MIDGMAKLKALSLKQKVLFGVAGVFILSVLVYGGINIYYCNRWDPYTEICDVDVSGNTLEQSKETLQKHIDNYVLHIEGRNDGTLEICGKDIDLTVEFEKELEALYKEKEQKFHFLHWGKKTYAKAVNAQFDENKLVNILQKSELVCGSDNYKIEKPKSAKIVYSEEKNSAIIQKEQLGNTIILSELQKVVKEQIVQMEDTLKLTAKKNENVYKKPSRYSNDEKLVNAIEKYNDYLLNSIVWDMGEDTTESITPENIKNWLSVNKDGKVKINEEKLNLWVETFCLKYKTQGTTRKFVTHDNRTINISEGDYGWRLDYKKTCKQALKSIRYNNEKADKDAYIKDPSEENRLKLTKNLEPIYSNTAYKRDYVNFSEDWDTENYSEVDIGNQMVYVYQKGKMVYSCVCVTGLLSDPERATKTGCYYIKDKKEEYTLVGSDYETPTKYWVRIMWTGTGYHYLARSDWSRWTPEIYKTRGSHGCINLQLEDAEKIFNLVHMGDAVFIHE